MKWKKMLDEKSRRMVDSTGSVEDAIILTDVSALVRLAVEEYQTAINKAIFESGRDDLIAAIGEAQKQFFAS